MVELISFALGGITVVGSSNKEICSPNEAFLAMVATYGGDCWGAAQKVKACCLFSSQGLPTKRVGSGRSCGAGEPIPRVLGMNTKNMGWQRLASSGRGARHELRNKAAAKVLLDAYARRALKVRWSDKASRPDARWFGSEGPPESHGDRRYKYYLDNILSFNQILISKTASWPRC